MALGKHMMRSRLHLRLKALALLLSLCVGIPVAAAQQQQRSRQQGQQGQKRVQQGGQGQQLGRVSQRQKQQRANKAQQASQLQSQLAEPLPYNGPVRRFHEVLDELLAEFGYDVRKGQIGGLKNVAIRKVSVNDTLPRTYENYVELLIAERIRENSRVRLISCVPCKTKSSTLIDGKLMISSPTTNLAQMDQAATQLGIENFMDVVLVYHTTHMVLALSVFNTQTKELTWARTYNSETVKSRFQKLAIDYSQVEKSRPSDEYQPEYKFLVGFGGSMLPNVSGGSSEKNFFTLQTRATEKFNNRKSEFGLLAPIWISTASLSKSYPTTGTDTTTTTTDTTATETTAEKELTPYRLGFGILATYAHNFLGAVESYDEVRYGVHTSLGIFVASAYFAPILKPGMDIYFGRRFVTTFDLIYLAPSQILVDGEFESVNGGLGADLVLSINF